MNTPLKNRKIANAVKFGAKAEAVITAAERKPLIVRAHLRPILSIQTSPVQFNWNSVN